ncbi:hypothetical protein ACFXPA_18895, partial [Amycolatopsis sp. NPDC059090]
GGAPAPRPARGGGCRISVGAAPPARGGAAPRAPARAHFPRASRVGTTAGQTYGGSSDPEHHFRFGLGRILDGIGKLAGA